MLRPRLSLKARALRYLSAREHSRLELTRKLSRYAQEGDNIDALLDQLEHANLLSQLRFSESLVNRRSTRFGNSRILSELQSHGIEKSELVTVKANLQLDEVARAIEVWQKKFGKKAIDAAERAKQTRFMLQRGFSLKAIQAAIKSDQIIE